MSCLFFLFLVNSFVLLMLMTGWSKFRPLAFPLISAIRDDPITLSRCSWFWNWNRFEFSLHPQLLLCTPKCFYKGFWQTFSKTKKQAFSVFKSNFPTSTSDFIKTINRWSWYLHQKKKKLPSLTLSKICIIP